MTGDERTTASSPGVYVDIDDVLGHTIEALIDLLEDEHGRRVDVEEVRAFDLGASFALEPEALHAFMERAHHHDSLHAIAPVRGAVPVLERWRRAGHDVHLITGRPPTTASASRRWLERHGFPFAALHFLDKYARPGWNTTGLPSLSMDDLHDLDLVLAVEDALEQAVRLIEQLDIEVALIDQPWNRDVSHLTPDLRLRLVRCRGWSDVARHFPVPAHRGAGPRRRGRGS